MSALYIMNFLMLIFLGVVYIFMPKIMNKYLLFGVTVTDELLEDEDVISAKKQYTLSMIVATIFISIIYLVWNIYFVDTAVWGFIGLLFGEIIIMSIFYLIAHFKVKRVKGTPVVEKRIISTEIGEATEIKVLPWYVFLVNIAIILGVVVYSFSIYESLPDVLTIHFDANGVADGFADKSYFYLLLMPFTMLLMTGLFIFVNYSFKIAKKVSGSSRGKLTIEQEKKSRMYWSIGIFTLGLVMTILFAVIQIFTLGVFTQNEMIMWLSTGSVLFIIVLVIILILTTGQSGSRVKTDKEQKDIVDADDDEHWRLGSIYFNKEDPSLFVNKRFGIGMTLNFAHKGAWVFMAVILLVVLASVLLPFILG